MSSCHLPQSPVEGDTSFQTQMGMHDQGPSKKATIREDRGPSPLSFKRPIFPFQEGSCRLRPFTTRLDLSTQSEEGTPMHGRRRLRYTRLNSLNRRGDADRPYNVPYYQFPALAGHDCMVHAIFTRKGGVSRPPYDGLNTSLRVGDNPEHVLQNLQIIKAIIGGRHLLSANQVHGSDVAVLLEGDSTVLDRPAQADAMITNVADLALMVKQADCQAVMLFDPVKHVIANVHCGWRGSVLNILEKVVRKMGAEFGSRAADLRAAIGPSLGPCCAEFRTYREILPEAFRAFMVSEGYFDFWRISRWQLMKVGVAERRIWIAGLCSRCNTDRFFSYRARNITGRSASVIMLNQTRGRCRRSSPQGPFPAARPLRK